LKWIESLTPPPGLTLDTRKATIIFHDKIIILLVAKRHKDSFSCL